MIAVLLLTLSAGVFAQDVYDPEDEYLATQYSLGDQMFSIHLGAIFPMINWAPSSSKFIDPNLSVGGSGYLEWSAFVNSHLSIGGNIGSSFMYTPADDILLLIPITVVTTWTFQVYPFDIPVFARTGINFTKRKPETFVGPILQLGSGFYWNMNSSWAFGARLTYTMLPVFFGSDSNRTNQNRIGNYAELHFGAVYHF